MHSGIIFFIPVGPINPTLAVILNILIISTVITLIWAYIWAKARVAKRLRKFAQLKVELSQRFPCACPPGEIHWRTYEIGGEVTRAECTKCSREVSGEDAKTMHAMVLHINSVAKGGRA